MQLIDGKPVFSATDLVGYLACEHLTAARACGAGRTDGTAPSTRPRARHHPRRGFQHEQRYLDDLVAEGRSVVDHRASDDRRGTRRRASRARRPRPSTRWPSGADVIYQATFFDGTWRGHADFLLRVEDADRPSVWGPWHYEVADTKLARHVKASAVLQICSYVEQLERLQGVRPEWLHVALGGSARECVELRVDDYMAYYRAAKRRFRGGAAATYPTGEHLPGAGRALRRLPLGRAMHGPAPRRRPPLAWSPGSAAGSGRR